MDGGAEGYLLAPKRLSVSRLPGRFTNVFVNRSHEWAKAVNTCIWHMDGGLYQDVTECIEGRMVVNHFSLHFQVMRPHRPIVAALLPRSCLR